jgi:hypothetical protein
VNREFDNMNVERLLFMNTILFQELIINAKGEERDDWTKVEPLSNLKDIIREIEG